MAYPEGSQDQTEQVQEKERRDVGQPFEDTHNRRRSSRLSSSSQKTYCETDDGKSDDEQRPRHRKRQRENESENCKSSRSGCRRYETKEQREKRLRAVRERARERRQHETKEEHRARLDREASRLRMLRTSETEEEREKRRQGVRERLRKMRQNFTEEQRQQRRMKEALNQREKRARQKVQRASKKLKDDPDTSNDNPNSVIDDGKKDFIDEGSLLEPDITLTTSDLESNEFYLQLELCDEHMSKWLRERNQYCDHNVK